MAAITGTNTGDQDLSSYATNTNLALKADIASPTLTGTPAAPTATAGTNTTQIATTAFVKSAVSTATSGNFVDLTTNQQIAGKKTFWRHIKLYTNNMPQTMNIGFPPNGENQTAIAMGIDALYTHRYGERTIGIGHEALYKDIRGSDNIGIGYRALYNIEHTSANDWGNRNVAIGSQSGSNVIVGDNNTLIGTYSDTSTGGINNATALGYQAVVTADNTIQLGNASITNVKTSGTITAGAITIPNTDGANGQVLQTNGGGVLSWTTPSTGPFKTTANVTSNSNGDLVTDDFVFGSTSLNNITGSDDDYRMFFDKSKGAFRSGKVTGAQWDAANIGDYSVAIGDNTTASGRSSVAMGYNTTASGQYSLATGLSTTASGGFGSTAMGRNTTASENYSTAIGESATASGESSIAMGQNVTAKSFAEMTIGLHNTDYTPSSINSFNANDRLFVIGNGTFSSKSDALVVLKNGNTTLKGQLTLTNGTDSYTLPNTDGIANQVLQTNGSGVLSWSTPSIAASIREVADEFSAAGNQTSFTLTQTPSTNSKVKMYINGIRISNSAYSVSGTTLTYVPANNGAYALSASDRIQFDFYY